MGETIKRLGGVTTGLNIDTTLYTCPANTMAVVSFVSCCNDRIGGDGVSIRLAHVDGQINTVSAEDYICYDLLMGPSSASEFARGLCMSAADTLMVRANGDGVTVAWGAWGSEIAGAS